MRILLFDEDLSVDGGSTDPVRNLQLAAALKWAKEQDVPKENIEKALAKVLSMLTIGLENSCLRRLSQARQGKAKEGNSFTYEALAYNSVGLIM